MKDLTIAEILDFDIAKELKVKDPTQKDDLYMNFSKILFEQILLNTLHHLEDAHVDELNDMISTETNIPELLEFLDERMEGLAEIVGREIINLKQDAVELINNQN